MRRWAIGRVAAVLLLLVLGCSEEMPGLLLHVSVPAEALPQIGELTVTLAGESGPVGVGRDGGIESGVLVEPRDGLVHLRLPRRGATLPRLGTRVRGSP